MTSPALAVTVPYTNDFSGIGDNTAFTTETPDAKWTVVDGAYRFATSSTTNEAAATSLEITNAAGSPFTIETQFTVNDEGNLNNAAQTLGFGLFGSDAAFSSGSYYLADFSYAHGGDAPEGVLRILSQGDSNGFGLLDTNVDANPDDDKLAVEIGVTYTLRLVGTYDGSTLNMTLGLFDAAGTTQIGNAATASDTTPLTGTHFGYRNRHSIGGGAIDIDFDNFSIVPEPASLALLGAGGLLMLTRRRTRGESSSTETSL